MALASFSVSADSGAYWSVGGSLIDFDDSADSVKPKNIYGRFGYDFTDNIGIDLGTSLIEDDFSGVDFGVKTTFLFVKLGINVSDTSKIYAMFGPTNVELTGSVTGFSVSSDDSDNGVGFGIEFGSDASSAYHIEHITYFDKNGVEVAGLNFGYVGYFR